MHGRARARDIVSPRYRSLSPINYKTLCNVARTSNRCPHHKSGSEPGEPKIRFSDLEDLASSYVPGEQSHATRFRRSRKLRVLFYIKKKKKKRRRNYSFLQQLTRDGARASLLDFLRFDRKRIDHFSTLGGRGRRSGAVNFRVERASDLACLTKQFVYSTRRFASVSSEIYRPAFFRPCLVLSKSRGARDVHVRARTRVLSLTEPRRDARMQVGPF